MELPIYVNLEDFKENYLTHFQEWKDIDFFKDNSIEVDFEDYLSYYSDIINDTYDDIIKEVKENDLERLKEIAKEIKISDKMLFIYIEDNFKEDAKEYNYLKQPENFVNLRNLIDQDMFEIQHISDDNKEFVVENVVLFYSYCVDEINQFIYKEILKLDAYKNLIPRKQIVESQNRHTAPVIIAMLGELKMFAELNRRGFPKGAIIDSLYQIIGTNKKNIEKYYDSMVKRDNEHFKESHIKKAKDFLNSKGF